MFSPLTVKNYAIKSGKSMKDVRNAISESIGIADEMGMTDNEQYIRDTLETLLEINEDNKNINDLATRFLNSEHKSFDKFLAEVTSGNITVSSDIPQELKPEIPYKSKKKNKKDGEEEKKKKTIKIVKIESSENNKLPFKKKKLIIE